MAMNIYAQKFPKSSIQDLKESIADFVDVSDNNPIDFDTITNKLDSSRFVFLKDVTTSNLFTLFPSKQSIVLAPVRHTKDVSTQEDIYQILITDSEEVSIKGNELAIEHPVLLEKLDSVMDSLPEYVISVLVDSGAIEEYKYDGLKVLNFDIEDAEISRFLREGKALYVEETTDSANTQQLRFVLIPSLKRKRVSFIPCIEHNGILSLNFGNGKFGPFLYHIQTKKNLNSEKVLDEIRVILKVIRSFAIPSTNLDA